MSVCATPFYRPASAGTPKEDGIAINKMADLFVVSDGVSEPFSHSNPGIKYPGKMTGGQMVSQTIYDHVFSNSSLRSALVDANSAVLAKHLAVGKSPYKEAVATASVAACQIQDGEVQTILAGDCFILYKTSHAFYFLTNFDQAAFDFEEAGNEEFARCLKEANEDKRKAWDLYFPYFSKKQFFRANRNIGNGGHAALNGNSAFLECCTKRDFALIGIEWILLGSDGLLPANSTNPKNRAQLEAQLGKLYCDGGLPAVIEWRDKEDFLPHISGNPEASAIELKFS